jgi:chemotaxis protein CheX
MMEPAPNEVVPNEVSMALPPVLDLAAAGTLQTALLGMRGKPAMLDASEVQRMGGLCLQVLLAARAAWATDGHGFRIAHPSPGFTEATQLMAAEMLLEQPNAMERT